MKKIYLKGIVAAMAITLMAGVFSGCGSTSSDSKTSDKASSDTKKDVTGSITITGSTALKPLIDAINESFKDKYPDATVNVQGGGSVTGLNDVSSGNAQIGMSDVFAEEKLTSDQANALKDNKVCVVGFAAVVNDKVKVDNLTKDQLINIFTGKITNWKDVGGDDMKIVILSRPSSSGTKATFKKYALDGKDEAQGQSLTEDSSGTIQKTLKATPGSISYLASSYLYNEANKEGLKVLKFNGTEMNKDNITSGKYPIWSYEHMYTKGDPKSDDLSKVFLDYVNKEGKNTINKLGYIPVGDMKTKR